MSLDVKEERQYSKHEPILIKQTEPMLIRYEETEE